jgi:uncharacterized protein (TIGR03000 family)
MISLNVPGDAIVFINGRRTVSTGEERRYVSSNIEPGISYRYDVVVQVARDGNVLTDARTLNLRIGENQRFVSNCRRDDRTQVAAVK